MRNTDDLQERERFQPLGAPIRQPAAPTPTPKPQGPSGLVTGADGRLRTTTHPER